MRKIFFKMRHLANLAIQFSFVDENFLDLCSSLNHSSLIEALIESILSDFSSIASPLSTEEAEASIHSTCIFILINILPSSVIFVEN